MNVRYKIGTILAGATLAAATLASSAGAESGNLIINGDFTSGVQGWDVTSATKLEKIGGVARVTNVAGDGNQITALVSQCVDIQPETPYRLGARRWIPSGQDRSGSTHFGAYFYADDGCAGDQVDHSELLDYSTTGEWRESYSTPITPDGSAQSVLIRFNVVKNATANPALADATFLVYVDDIQLYEYEWATVAEDEPDCLCEPAAEDEPPLDEPIPGDQDEDPVPPAPEEPTKEDDKPTLQPPAPSVTPTPGEPFVDAPAPTTPTPGAPLVDEPLDSTKTPDDEQPGDQPSAGGNANGGTSGANTGEQPSQQQDGEKPAAPTSVTPGVPSSGGGPATDRPASNGGSIGPDAQDAADVLNTDEDGAAASFLPAVAGGAIGLGLLALLLAAVIRRRRTEQ